MSKNIKFYIGVKALMMNKKNEILLQKAAPPETRFEKEKVEFWDFPGGRVKEQADAEGVVRSATLEDTLIQECKEEIGAKSLQIDGIFHAVVSNFMIKDSATEQTPLTLIVYRCKTNASQPIRLSHEHTEYKWFSPQQAKSLLKTK